jgi:hypothetical protein
MRNQASAWFFTRLALSFVGFFNSIIEDAISPPSVIITAGINQKETRFQSGGRGVSVTASK